MNEMRYAKGNAKDYAQDSHPIKASSATVFGEHSDTVSASSSECPKAQTFLSVFMLVHQNSKAWKLSNGAFNSQQPVFPPFQSSSCRFYYDCPESYGKV